MPIHLAGTPRVRKTLLQVMYYLFPGEAPAAQTLWAVKAAPGSGSALELDFHGLHREASPIYTSILVIVDQLSKQSLFVPTYNTITSSDLVQLFVLHIFSKHGVPLHV